MLGRLPDLDVAAATARSRWTLATRSSTDWRASERRRPITSSCFTTTYIVTPEPCDTPLLDSAQVVARSEATVGRDRYRRDGRSSCWRDHSLPAPGAPGPRRVGPTGVLTGGLPETPSGGPPACCRAGLPPPGRPVVGGRVGPTGRARAGLPERLAGRACWTGWACRNTLGRADRRAGRVGLPERSRVGRRGHRRVGRPGYWRVDQRECCRAVPPERCREPRASRSQPTPPSTSCPGIPNVRRHAQPLHRHAATGPRQPWDRPGQPASRRTQEVQCNRRRNAALDVHLVERTVTARQMRTPTPPRAGSPLAPPSLVQADRKGH